MKNPCYDCPDREVGCHSKCIYYEIYKEKSKKKKAFLETDKVFGDYAYHAIKRMKGVRA